MQDSQWLKRQQLWCEAAQTATMLDNILVQESAKSPPFTQFFGVDAKYAKHLRVFGEMCVVADTDNKVGRTKIDPRGKISLFVGYSTQHAGDVYRLLNPKTSRVIHSRDVKWIGKTWAELIIENMKGKVVDIDNAFLNGDLEHEIYMKIPEGYDEVINPGVDKEDCLILQKAIYGLVQAARQFWKKIVDKMQEGGFKLSEADPCMLYKEDEKGVCIIIIYIDDMLIIGKEEAIDDAIKVLQGHFQVKDPTSLEDYLGVQIVQSDDGKKAWLGQPTIIKSLEKQFGERVAKKKMTVTPGTPGFIGGKVDDISKVDQKTQSMYRSGVGTLLYLTKHSRPDITNPVRELSKSMDGASMAQVTEMYRVINFVLETKTLGLRMVPIFNDGVWKLEALSDSDFANDKDTRYSVYGYIIYFCGVPVAWKSKSMKSVVLSTTEAEYVAVSEVVKEIKFFVPNAKEHGDQGTTTYQGSSGQCWCNMVGK